MNLKKFLNIFALADGTILPLAGFFIGLNLLEVDSGFSSTQDFFNNVLIGLNYRVLIFAVLESINIIIIAHVLLECKQYNTNQTNWQKAHAKFSNF